MKFGEINRVHQDVADIYRRYPSYHAALSSRLCGSRFDDPFYDLIGDNTIRNVKQAIKRYCELALDMEYYNTKGFYLYSPVPGRCKTSIMACAYNWFIDNRIKCIATNLKDIYDCGETSYNQRFNDWISINNVPVLMIDDIGIDDLSKGFKGPDWNNLLYDLINSRNNSNYITCFTSNYLINELNDRGYLPQITSRINEMTSGYFLSLDGEDLRFRADLSEIIEKAWKEKERRIHLELEKEKRKNSERAHQSMEQAKRILEEMKRRTNQS